jgi:hypothetical protein
MQLRKFVLWWSITPSLSLAAVGLLFAFPSDDPSSAFKRSPLPTRLPIGNLLLLLLRKSFLFFLLPKSNVKRTKIALYSLSFSPPLSLCVCSSCSLVSLGSSRVRDWLENTNQKKKKKKQTATAAFLRIQLPSRCASVGDRDPSQ